MATLWRGTTPARCSPGGDGRRRIGELAVADVLPAAFLYVVGQHDELRLLGMPLHVPGQHVEQGASVHRRAGLPGGRVGRRGGDEGPGQRVPRGDGRRRGPGARVQQRPLHRAQQVGHGFGALQRVRRQVDAAGLFRAEQQFHAPQAVETEVAIQHAGQQHRGQFRVACVQFAQRGLDGGDHARGRIGRRGCLASLRCRRRACHTVILCASVGTRRRARKGCAWLHPNPRSTAGECWQSPPR